MELIFYQIAYNSGFAQFENNVKKCRFTQLQAFKEKFTTSTGKRVGT